MSIQQHQVDRLKEVYRQEFKRELSNEEAWEMAYRLMDFIDVLLEASAFLYEI